MTLHADAQEALAGWTAPDAEQDRLRHDYLAHLERHPEAMSRGCHPDHLTGGHCEPDDLTLAAAALREGREESGIHALTIDPVPLLLSRHEVPCGPIRPSHHLDVQFLAVAPPDAQHVISDESDDLAWFEFDALPQTDQSVHDLIAAATTRLRESP